MRRRPSPPGKSVDATSSKCSATAESLGETALDRLVELVAEVGELLQARLEVLALRLQLGEPLLLGLVLLLRERVDLAELDAPRVRGARRGWRARLGHPLRRFRGRFLEPSARISRLGLDPGQLDLDLGRPLGRLLGALTQRRLCGAELAQRRAPSSPVRVAPASTLARRGASKRSPVPLPRRASSSSRSARRGQRWARSASSTARGARRCRPEQRRPRCLRASAASTASRSASPVSSRASRSTCIALASSTWQHPDLALTAEPARVELGRGGALVRGRRLPARLLLEPPRPGPARPGPVARSAPCRPAPAAAVRAAPRPRPLRASTSSRRSAPAASRPARPDRLRARRGGARPGRTRPRPRSAARRLGGLGSATAPAPAAPRPRRAQRRRPSRARAGPPRPPRPRTTARRAAGRSRTPRRHRRNRRRRAARRAGRPAARRRALPAACRSARPGCRARRPGRAGGAPAPAAASSATTAEARHEERRGNRSLVAGVDVERAKVRARRLRPPARAQPAGIPSRSARERSRAASRSFPRDARSDEVVARMRGCRAAAVALVRGCFQLGRRRPRPLRRRRRLRPARGETRSRSADADSLSHADPLAGGTQPVERSRCTLASTGGVCELVLDLLAAPVRSASSRSSARDAVSTLQRCEPLLRGRARSAAAPLAAAAARAAAAA